MHSLPNQNTVRRFRFAAFLLLLKWMFLTGFLGLFGYSMWMERSDLTWYAMGLLGLGVVVSLAHWMIGARARCPLCFVPSFSHQQCSKHRKAPHFLGSYRLFVALAVIFKGYFRCPYCGEPTAMEVRTRSRSRNFHR
jgi:hypothetical protein